MNVSTLNSNSAHRVYTAAAARAFDEYASVKNAPSCTEEVRAAAFAAYEARIQELRKINNISA